MGCRVTHYFQVTLAKLVGRGPVVSVVSAQDVVVVSGCVRHNTKIDSLLDE